MSEPTVSSQIVELVAYALYEQTGSEQENTAKLSAWQTVPELRKEYRERAVVLLATLEEKGVKLAPARTSTVDRAVRDLAIVPARMAYQLADET